MSSPLQCIFLETREHVSHQKNFGWCFVEFMKDDLAIKVIKILDFEPRMRRTLYPKNAFNIHFQKKNKSHCMPHRVISS